MRPSILLVSLLFAASPGAFGSWFGSDDPAYNSWDNTQLKQWLDEHQITTPSDQVSHSELVDLVKSNWNTASAWTYDQYSNAQKTFANLRDTTFDSWDESRLREFLLEQGVVAPSGPREELVLLAKNRYRAYTDAASSFTSSASTAASSAIHGDKKTQATRSISSFANMATKDAQRALDDSRDYVYSTWDDNQLRSYLEQKGLLKTKSEKKRQEMLAMMSNAYAKVSDPVWMAWSDSYMRDWLVDHKVIDDRSSVQKKRDDYLDLMKQYYYSSNDHVWDSWSDSQLRSWLVDHSLIKSDAQMKREKMIKLVGLGFFRDNYSNARDTAWTGWSDSQIRQWLIDNGYMKSDAQAKRDELVKLMNDKYTNVAERTASYHTWPDARLRAYLRENGVSDKYIPTTRQGLLQETRARWVQSTGRAEALFQSIRDITNNNIEAAEDSLLRVWELLSGKYSDVEGKAEQAGKKVESQYEQQKGQAYEKAEHVGKKAESQYEEKKGKAYDKAQKAESEL